MYFDKLDGRIDTDFFDRNAGALFRRRCRAEKRWHLASVLSNCIWKDGQRTATDCQPLHVPAKDIVQLERKKPAEGSQTGFSDNWLRLLGSNQRPAD